MLIKEIKQWSADNFNKKKIECSKSSLMYCNFTGCASTLTNPVLVSTESENFKISKGQKVILPWDWELPGKWNHKDVIMHQTQQTKWQT